jgi:outer membrane protein TolC
MKPLRLVAALLVLTPARAAWAEDRLLLTWDQCLARAAAHNPVLRSASKTLEASRARYSGSWNGILPSLDLSHSYVDGSGIGDGVWQAGASASIDLFSPLSYARIRSAAAQRRQSAAGLDLSASNVLSDLHRSFAALLYAQESVQVATRIDAIWRDNAQLVRLRYNSGRESKGNDMRTEAELLQAQADLAQAKRDVRVAQQALGKALGEDQFALLVATGTLATSAAPVAPPFEQLTDAHPRVRVQKATVERAHSDVSAARSALWPTLSANYSRTLVGTTYFPSNPGWTASGVLSYPLFGGGPTAVYYDVTATKRLEEASQEDLRAVRLQVRADLETAWSAYAQALDSVRVQSAFLEASRQRRAEADIRYRSGLMSFEDWELIVIDLANFERGALRARRDANLAEAQWNLAGGQGLGS